MHNTRIRAAGTWIGVILQADLEALDQGYFEAVNGDDGGTWAPTTQIIFGGSGFRVTGVCQLDNVQLLDVWGLARFYNDVHFDNNQETRWLSSTSAVVESGAFFYVDGEIHIRSGGELSVLSGGIGQWASGSFFGLAAGTTTVLAADLNVSGQTIRSSATGRDRIHSNRTAIITADSTLGVEVDDVIIDQAGAGIITLTLKIATSPAPTRGETIYVRRINSGVGGAIVKNEGSAATLVTFPGSQKGNAIIRFDGTAWRVYSNVDGTLGADAVG